MSRLEKLICLAGLALALLVPAAHAETYPTKSIRIIVSYATGDGTDILARLFAQKLGDSWGQTVIVGNRPGANGIFGSEVIARSPPYDYNLVLVVAAHVINPNLKAKMPFDTLKDSTSISMVATSPLVVVSPGVSANNIEEPIALAKAQPGKLSSSSSEPSSRLAGDQFKSLAGTELLHAPYKGDSQIMIEPAQRPHLGRLYQRPYRAATPQVKGNSACSASAA